MSVHIVSPRIGHSSPSFTWDTYAKSIPASDRQAAKTVEDALSKLIDETRSREGREVAQKYAKIAELNELNYSLRPFNPITTGLSGHDEQIVWGGRGVSNPNENADKPNDLTV